VGTDVACQAAPPFWSVIDTVREAAVAASSMHDRSHASVSAKSQPRQTTIPAIDNDDEGLQLYDS
jgi:hypothetical protein